MLCVTQAHHQHLKGNNSVGPQLLKLVLGYLRIQPSVKMLVVHVSVPLARQLWQQSTNAKTWSCRYHQVLQVGVYYLYNRSSTSITQLVWQFYVTS